MRELNWNWRPSLMGAIVVLVAIGAYWEGRDYPNDELESLRQEARMGRASPTPDFYRSFHVPMLSDRELEAMRAELEIELKAFEKVPVRIGDWKGTGYRLPYPKNWYEHERFHVPKAISRRGLNLDYEPGRAGRIRFAEEASRVMGWRVRAIHPSHLLMAIWDRRADSEQGYVLCIKSIEEEKLLRLIWRGTATDDMPELHEFH